MKADRAAPLAEFLRMNGLFDRLPLCRNCGGVGRVRGVESEQSHPCIFCGGAGVAVFKKMPRAVRANSGAR